MFINNSYNKKDLLHIIEKHELGIDYDAKIHDKKQIKLLLEEYINEYNIIELHYLKDENKLSRLKVKEKNEILASAKKIISFCKNGYNIKRSLYPNYYELLNEAKYIANYGDISSVRRAIKLLNLRHEPPIHINISGKVEELLKQKEILKNLSVPVWGVSKGKYKLSFD